METEFVVDVVDSFHSKRSHSLQKYYVMFYNYNIPFVCPFGCLRVSYKKDFDIFL